MRLITGGLLVFVAQTVFFSLSAAAQLTIDATGPVHEKQRRAMAVHGGSAGRKLPLQVVIEGRGPSPTGDGTTEVEFVLTNSGKKELTVPVSPNPGDLEPADPKANYTVRHLSLYVTSDKKQTSILLPGTHLYGSRAFPATLVTLAPGESIQVLTRVALPSVLDKDGTSTAVFVAHAALNAESVKTVGGQPLLDEEEIGSASSQEYTPEALKPHN